MEDQEKEIVINEDYKEMDKLERELEWFESFPEVSEDIQAHLYCFKNGKRERVTRYDGYVPDSHDIGLEWGAGKYFYMVKQKGQPVKTREFYVSESYGAGRKKEDPAKKEPVNNSVASEVVVGITTAVKELYPLFAPLLDRSAIDTVPQQMLDLYGKMGTAMADNITKQSNASVQFTKELTKELTESMRDQQLYVGSQEVTQDKVSLGGNMGKRIVGMVWKLIKPKIGKWIESGKVGGVDLSTIKNNKFFASIAGDPESLEQLADLIADSFGEEILEEITDSVAELVD